MKKLLSILIMCLLLKSNAYANNIKKFQIENIRIGDSALDYFSGAQIEDNEMDWLNYSYKEYATSLLPGKGIYDWFLISYKSDDDNFTIEGLVGVLVKKNYDNNKCNNELDNATVEIAELFKKTNKSKKQLYKVAYNSRKIFQKPDPSGKSIVTSISFDFEDDGKIILSCYDMDKATNEINSPIKDINQFDTFRIDVRSRALTHYLEKA